MRRPRETEAAWLATLGGGLIVLLAVGGLLELLRRSVIDVERAVDDIWTSGKQLAQNTQAAHLLHTTRARSATLREELERRPRP